MPLTKRLKQCPDCRRRVRFKLDPNTGGIVLEQHALPTLSCKWCPGSGKTVVQR